MKSAMDTSALGSTTAPAACQDALTTGAHDWPRRRASDSVRMSPMRRLGYEWLATAVLLPLCLIWLSDRDGLWHANALAHDMMLAHSGASVPSTDIVLLPLDEPCPLSETACAALPMRYREILSQLPAHRPRAVLLDTAPLGPQEVMALRQLNTALASGLPLYTTTSPYAVEQRPWAEPDRDGLTRSIRTRQAESQGDALHPALAALGLSAGAPALPERIDLRWNTPVDSAYPTMSYAGLLLGQYPATALHGKLVVVGPRYAGATSHTWLIRDGSRILTLPSTDAQAQVLDNLARAIWVKEQASPWAWLWATLPVWVGMVLVRRWPERMALLLLGTTAVVAAVCWYALIVHRLWLPVATPLVGLLLVQLLWTWRRSVAVGQMLQRRLDRLQTVLAQSPNDLDPRAMAQAERRTTRPRPQVEMLDDTLDRLEAQHQIQRRMQQQRDRWLAFLSHDLRAPQSNILSLLALHENRVEGMTEERLFSGVRVQVDRTLRLAEGFVDLLRAESDHLKLRHCTLGGLSIEAVDRCWPQAQAQRVKIVQRGLEDELGPVHGDPELLIRAMVNILSNAVRHSETGEAVEVCLAHDAEQGVVAWSVRDQGPGMSASQLSALMQSLESQTWMRPRPASDAGRGHGLGLGLLVASTVVSRHQGELHAMAAPGQGCCFIVALPAATPPTKHRALLGQAWSSFNPETPPDAIRALPV